MPKAFLIHGWEGRPDGHWFPWLALELKARGWEVNAPQMPNSENPRVLEWTGFLEKYVGKPDKNTYFVGHSLGCFAIVRYIELLPKKVQIGGCVFVAGFSGRLIIPDVAEFYELFDSEKAKRHCEKFVTIFSDNDPDIPLEKSLEFAKQLNAKTVMQRGKGHFTTEDGVTALPSVLTALLRMQKS